MVSDHHTEEEMRSELEWTVSRVPEAGAGRGRRGDLRRLPEGGATSRWTRPSLLAHGITLADVAEALRKSNRNAGGGFLIHGDQQLIVRGVGYVVDPSDIKAVVLKNDGGTPVTIGDVSKVLLSHTPRQGSVGYNLDAQAVEGFVLMRRGENPSVVLEACTPR
jgi:cobalt-zinc-cadmium resistance protein CzcA